MGHELIYIVPSIVNYDKQGLVDSVYHNAISASPLGRSYGQRMYVVTTNCIMVNTVRSLLSRLSVHKHLSAMCSNRSNIHHSYVYTLSLGIPSSSTFLL